MFSKGNWFLAAMLTGGALALAGCDDSGISQDTYNTTSKNTAEQQTLIDEATALLEGTEPAPTADVAQLTSNTPEAGSLVADAKAPTADVAQLTSNTPEAGSLVADAKAPTADVAQLTSNTPEAGSLVADAKVPPDYQGLGEWMNTSQGVAQSSPVFGGIAMSGPEFEFTKVGNNQPIAKAPRYMGRATGDYSLSRIGTEASYGSYTADVSLTADFEVPVVSGTVTNFHDKRTYNDLKLKVNLSKTKTILDAPGGPFEGAIKSATDEELIGTWKGKFYGVDAPSSAGGMFYANEKQGSLNILRISGKFGALIEPSQ